MARLPTVGNDTGQWGSVLNEFLSVAFNPDGTLKSQGFTNPMLALGDLIIGGTSGVPGRLPIGSNGFFLGVVGGLPAWLPVPSGFANPMNSIGDLIIGGAGGAAQKLSIGGAGQVLGIASGSPSWVNNPAGFTSPMTTLGDIITGGAAGAAQRLAPGAAGQSLQIVAGVPAWANNPAGFANPMTASGDLITGGTAGAASRLPVGANDQFLGVAAGAVSWLPAPSSPFEIVVPSGDTTGTNDDLAFNNAIAALPNGGTIYMFAGATPFYTKNGWVPPAQTTAGTTGGNPVCVQGVGFPKLMVVGANKTGISYHRTSGYGAQYNPGASGAQPPVGFIRDIWISGLNSTGASIGLDVGDGWGFDIRVYVSDFDTVGAMGCQIINRVFWTEKNNRFLINSSNNTVGIYMTTSVADVSHEYCWFDFNVFCNQNQSGVVIDGGVNAAGCFTFIRGNMCQTTATSGIPTNNTALLTLKGTGPQGGSRFYFGQLWMKVEFNQSSQFTTGSVAPWTIYSDGNGYIRSCSGQITSSLNGIQMNGAEFSFSGLIGGGDMPSANGGNGATASNLFPTLPALNATWTNKGPDAIVAIAGGSVTGITLNGVATGFTATNMTIPVGAKGTLLVNGTGVTLTAIPARTTFS